VRGAAFLPSGRGRLLAPLAAVLASGLAIVAALDVLLGTSAWDFERGLRLPLGTCHFGMDALSAVFVLLIGLVGGLAAIYGTGYLGGKTATKSAIRSWSAFNTLLAAMILVVVARDGFLFLLAWELMSLASFFLVLQDHERPEVVRAGWIYLVATHAATAFLLVLFSCLATAARIWISPT